MSRLLPCPNHRQIRPHHETSLPPATGRRSVFIRENRRIFTFQTTTAWIFKVQESRTAGPRWRGWLALSAFVLAAPVQIQGADNQAPPGFTSLFNGKDLSGWKIPAGDNGHWKSSGRRSHRLRRPSEASGDKRPL